MEDREEEKVETPEDQEERAADTSSLDVAIKEAREVDMGLLRKKRDEAKE